MSSVLYDGKDVIVYVGSNGSKRGVITFGGWRQDLFGNRPAASAQGFGEGAFLKHGIDEFHVVPRANHWYQTDEMKAVEELARSFSATRTVATYGSSMGGYGAVLFASLLDVPALSFSPQFSLNPETVPWEVRWREDAEKIECFDSEAIARSGLARGYLFYDPFTKLDAAQANLFRESTELTFIPVPFSGHATIAAISKFYPLRNVVSDVLDQSLTRQKFQAARQKDGRVSSDVYVAGLYRQAILRKKGRTETWATEELKKRIETLSAKAFRDLYFFEVRRGEKAKANVWVEAALKMVPADSGDCYILGWMAKHAGMTEDAKRLLEHGLSFAPNKKVIQKMLAQL